MSEFEIGVLVSCVSSLAEGIEKYADASISSLGNGLSHRDEENKQVRLLRDLSRTATDALRALSVIEGAGE